MNTAARPYRQSQRADAAAATGRRIVDAFLERARSGWLDEITLDDVARSAGVTVQTVIRRFGGKEGLTQAAADQLGAEVAERREVPEGDWRGHVLASLADYEIAGDLVIRLLAQEERWPALRPALAIGRARHRELIERVYRPFFGDRPPEEQRQVVAALVVLTDVYAWRLLRRDQGFDLPAATAITLDLVARLLDQRP
jgi:AcrR family transcriptional regulator